MTQLELVSPTEHFKEKVSEASRSLNLSLSADVEFYIVNLLCKFIKPGQELSLDTPLVLRLKSAIESSVQERNKHLKWLGDTSLYLAGFFQDYFNQKTYDISYYITMGQNAYLILSEGPRDYVGVYKDLADTFSHLVELVATVAEDIADKRNVNLLATYDRWTRTGSTRLRKILEEEGITPIEVNMNRAQ